MEEAKFKNVSQPGNIFNIIGAIQQKNHDLKSFLPEKGKLHENDEESIKQNLDTVLFLNQQVNTELLEKIKSAKQILQATTEIISALCEPYRLSVGHRVSAAHFSYLERTNNFLNRVIVSYKSAENSLHNIDCCTSEGIHASCVLVQSQLLPNSERMQQNQNSGREKKMEGEEILQTPLSNSTNNQVICENKHYSLAAERESSLQLSSCSNFQPAQNEVTEVTVGIKDDHFQTADVCYQGQKGVKNQRGIPTPDEMEDQSRAIKEMNCSSEVKDTDGILKSRSVGHKCGGEEIHLPAFSETGEVAEKKLNTLNDKNEMIIECPAEAVKMEERRDWSQRELFAEMNGKDDPQTACYVTAPLIVVQKLLCRILNNRSPMVVNDGEELVSNVISIECTDSKITIPFPVKIAIPFSARYQGNYREIMVKVLDATPYSCYISPISSDRIYSGHNKGSCAEVKIYKLGIFSVVSCLRKETFTVPRKGLSLKLSMDSRITLNYLPGSFSTPVFVQSKVQPIDSTLLSGLKSRQDIYHPIISTSPLVHIKHPSTLQFRKSIMVTLPCPPNPDKKKLGDEKDNARAATAMVHRSSSHRIRHRLMSAPVKRHGDAINEPLKLLGFNSKIEEWLIMDNVTMKDMQNGLVAFEIAENLDRFIVLRLSSSVDNSCLIPFIHELEEAIRFTMVNIIMYHKRENSHRNVVQMVPSRDLQWELAKLHEEGYRGPPEPSEEFPMREGEQIILKFSGNIKSLGNDQDMTQGYPLIFHSQRKSRLELDLTVVDEFGNYCSPHYKGMTIFYKVTKEDLAQQLDGDYHMVNQQHYNPVCKLALTLPKREKRLNHSTSVNQISPPESTSGNVLYWLASELSEEDAMMLVTSLRMRRSAIQLVKLNNPDDLTDQIFKMLNMWKKLLPTSINKVEILSRHLKRCGREDLAEELWSKQDSEE
ncbi:death domain-containing protein 1 [Chiloscyllium plagiosum]|uniref:death domain-containing protein 1 n=1 Tax=Chiloscyllium plagiosum TaxID=36176 RepID=UPI001CB869E7|nr:death domain-containing protein 1 [Chiloscyllium plagiosum]